MEASERIEGGHVTLSPCGSLIVFLTPTGKLRVAHAHSPQRAVDFTFRASSKDVISLKWSEDSARVAICSPDIVEVLDLDDAAHRVRLDNGSGGLGHFRSADFLGDNKLLTVWEFGNAKIWDLGTGKGFELQDLKTFTSTPAWQLRPKTSKEHPPILATLSRHNGEDMLSIHFAGSQLISKTPQKVPGDTRTLSWSPDGRWLALNGAPYISPCMHVYTADGHHFRAFDGHDKAFNSSAARRWEDEFGVIGVKDVIWSPNSQVLALARYNGSIPLLNTRTFGSLAIIEHFTTIDQSDLSPDDRALIYEEVVSASNERSYNRSAHPVSPPRSEVKDKAGTSEQGVAEAKFSCDGAYLATRDARMQSTVWIWSMAQLGAQAVIIQHSNIRRVHWHSSQPCKLMLDCGEGIAYVFDTSTGQAPSPYPVSLPGNTVLSWIRTPIETKPAILAATKSAIRIIYPEGRDETLLHLNGNMQTKGASFEEGASEDSIVEMLSGRKPMPPRHDLSYTQRIDMETDEDETGVDLDDTFREKRRVTARQVEEEIDPLDDSQIF
jgi:WD40 repeat protein